jgi:hypothetical protein
LGVSCFDSERIAHQAGLDIGEERRGQWHTG